MKKKPQTTIKNHKTNPLITLFLLLITFALSIWAEKTHKAKIYVQTGHTGSVRSVAYSPDGKTIASGSFDKTIRLWDAASGKRQRVGNSHWAFRSGHFRDVQPRRKDDCCRE